MAIILDDLVFDDTHVFQTVNAWKMHRFLFALAVCIMPADELPKTVMSLTLLVQFQM